MFLNVMMGYVFPYKRSAKLLLRSELEKRGVPFDLFPPGCLDELDQLGINAYNQSSTDLKNSRPIALADMTEKIKDIAKNVAIYLAGQPPVTEGEKVYDILENHQVIDRSMSSREYVYERSEYEDLVAAASLLNEEYKKIIADGKDKIQRSGKAGPQMSDLEDLVEKLKAADRLAGELFKNPKKSSEVQNPIVFDFEENNIFVLPNVLYFKVPYEVISDANEKLKLRKFKTSRLYEHMIDKIDHASSIWEQFRNEALGREIFGVHGELGRMMMKNLKSEK